jgi:hypothetical protein
MNVNEPQIDDAAYAAMRASMKAQHSGESITSRPFGPEYPKINTVFKRDMANNGLIIPSEFSTEEFAYLANTPWRWTEKVDGTNIRVHFDGEKVTISGRTDSAQVPGPLFYALAFLNNPGLFNRVFADSTKVKPYEQDVTIYGEGYGPKIQSGGQYRNDVGFIVFDIKVGRWWLKPEDVTEAAGKLGLDVVPEYPIMTLNEAIAFVSGSRLNKWSDTEFPGGADAFKSHWMNAKPEGLVGTPTVPLFARNGERIIAKLKSADFESLAKHRTRQEPSTPALHGHGPGYD